LLCFLNHWRLGSCQKGQLIKFQHKIDKNLKVIRVRNVESVERPPYWIARKCPLNCDRVVYIESCTWATNKKSKSIERSWL
jgi:hypothetical protein